MSTPEVQAALRLQRTFDPVAFSRSMARTTKALTEGMRRAAQQTSHALKEFTRTMNTIHNRVVEAANAEDVVFNRCIQFKVRGGLGCRTESEILFLVGLLMSNPGWMGDTPNERMAMRMLTRQNRARLAAAALEGYVRHVDQEPPNLTWWRQRGPRGSFEVRGF